MQSHDLRKVVLALVGSALILCAWLIATGALGSEGVHSSVPAPAGSVPVGDRNRASDLPMAGGNDGKYAALAQDMGRRIPRAMVAVAPGAGHALVGERPADVAALLAGWTGSR